MTSYLVLQILRNLEEAGSHSEARLVDQSEKSMSIFVHPYNK